MDLEEYKRKRSLEEAQRAEENRNKRELCLGCMRPKKACFCRGLHPIETRVEIRLLMHPKEYKKQKIGTGRLTELALEKCKIIVGADFDQNEEVQGIIGSDEYLSMILYPGKNSINLSQRSLPNFITSASKKLLVFVLDGTWPCAKSMMKHSKSLQGLPRVSFDSSCVSQFAIKHQPAKYCLSTIESVYQLLMNFEKNGLEDLGSDKDVLLQALNSLVEFQKKCALDAALPHYRGRSLGYKEPSARKHSKKWKHRHICFEDAEYE